tara:strand:+ start:1694 stop:2023 length:330 start_codon:yes stop_codon:yes gene_type:complete
MTTLNKTETSNIYNKINKVSYHLANKTKNTESLSEELRKKAYYSIQKGLRANFVKYDRETKLASLLKKEAMLDKYGAMTNTPKTLWNDAPTAIVAKASKKKTTSKSKRI